VESTILPSLRMDEVFSGAGVDVGGVEVMMSVK
jgi:hypothetical protein